MTYFNTSIYKTYTRPKKVGNRVYSYLEISIPIRKGICSKEAVYPVWRFRDIPLMAINIDRDTAECISRYSSEIDADVASPFILTRRKYAYTYDECRLRATMYIRRQQTDLYGKAFLVYYDKLKPEVVAFPASPAVNLPHCVAEIIDRALQRHDTVVRGFSPYELHMILYRE